MEPVPETEPMDAFQAREHPGEYFNRPLHMFSTSTVEPIRKPMAIRRATDPSPTSLITPSGSLTSSSSPFTYRPRTTSPLTGLHTRSKSSTAAAPPMARTRSLPIVNTSSRLIPSRPDSPSGSPNRHRAMRKPADEGFPMATPSRSSVIDPDRRLRERSQSPTSLGSIASSSLTRFNRPSSPLRPRPSASSSSLASCASLSSSASLTPSGASSPYHRPYDTIHEGFASMHLAPMPLLSSTPLSIRSRSPSISSLETIPDTPDEEAAALEAEKQAREKAEADRGEEVDLPSRGSLDIPTRGRTLGLAPRDKRKRWSVCGAERRGDLDLETIWED